jgi:NADH:ubiquinone oxidoreductase subunit 2 (subunit N)
VLLNGIVTKLYVTKQYVLLICNFIEHNTTYSHTSLPTHGLVSRAELHQLIDLVSRGGIPPTLGFVGRSELSEAMD